jgi:hypothetical protein
MNIFEYQAKTILYLLNISWNAGPLNEDEKALLREIIEHFPHLKDDSTHYAGLWK